MKTTTLAVAIIAAITPLGGCMLPKVNNMTAQQFKDSHTHVSRDDFEKTTRIETSRIFFPKKYSLPPNKAYFLNATKKDGEKAFYRIQLYSKNSMRSGGRVFWERAADQNGNKFSLESNGVDINDVFIEEWSSAQVSREYLESIRKTGITWRFYGRATATAPIDSQVVDGFLMKVDEIFRK
jgi:hypothetical protein